MNGGSGVSIGGVKILRAAKKITFQGNTFNKWPFSLVVFGAFGGFGIRI